MLADLFMPSRPPQVRLMSRGWYSLKTYWKCAPAGWKLMNYESAGKPVLRYFWPEDA